MTDISRQIWDMKYRLKQPDGTPVDGDIPATWARVALAAAQAEAPEARREWAVKFGAALAGHRFLPAGRIVAGAGTERSVTLFNCFVMGTIPDDMGGIFAHLREAALTLQQGGGIGYDFSTLRPRGALVKGVGADASGPVSFMEVWDAMCRTIMSAGSRRGAMMATLACDHPDIENFIDAKRTPGRLSNFNLSVLVSDAFMAAVKANADWDLKFNGKVYRTLRARDLWDRIMRATYEYAEPGVIFIDRINAQNNLAYCESIQATNPCLTADTWIMTADGPRQIAELTGRPFTAIAEGRLWPSAASGFFSQGVKPTVQLRTREGQSLRLTADHRIRRVTKSTRWVCEWEWVETGSLSAGDEILLHDHRAAPSWGNTEMASQDGAEGYLLGLLLGDGVLKADKAVLSVWPGQKVANGADERPGIQGVMEAAFEAASQLPHRADFQGWVEVPGRGEYRLSLSALKRLAHEHGMAPGAKRIAPEIERRSSAFACAFLRGLFDADGSVQGNQNKGVSVRLSQSDLATLEAAQRMLLRLGIASAIYAECRPEGLRLLPNGKGGSAPYKTRAQHELVVSGANLAAYAERIGFSDTAKSLRLKSALESHKRSLNRERFAATVATVSPAGDAEVFDATIPGLNAFDANGLWAHNCGEQPLPPYGACLLGSINLAKLVRHPFDDNAALDEDELENLTATAIRLLDNVIDVSRFPLPEQRAEALAKRRIGLGITGLADALIFCRARYGSPQSIALIERWLSRISIAAYRASAQIAREKGAFPLFDREQYLSRPNILALPEDIRDMIAEHGIRNALVTSIAPTGTISLFADNVSSGIEPVFAYSYTRKVLLPDGSRTEENVSDYAYRLYRARFGEEAALPDYFVNAQTLSPADHLAVQAAAQKYVDSSISKTINVPVDISFDAFEDVYLKAYETGCKGCTTYRPNAVTGSVLASAPQPVALTVPPQESDDEPVLPMALPHIAPPSRENSSGVVYMTQPLDRPEVLIGQTYKIKWLDSDHAFYITINDIEKDGRRRPFEIFINSKNMEAYAWTLALTRMISAVFRRGGDVSFVVEELKAVFDPRGGQWMDKHYVPSLLAAIGEVIERHLIATGFMKAGDPILPDEKLRAVAQGQEIVPARFCPRCSSPSFVKLEGCDTCLSCGYSKCG
ncbi:MAG TPA: LAGLIDADG family homing endonuclease [Rhizomicrobium sp.]|jgi:ribonucleoside-diphosphate reductase alpha chain|nr:LAGLIDADG family homing endonuclease [Rhizomicrobium sp.]